MSLQFCSMAVHIGEKIKSRAKELRIGPTELGKMINTSKQNVYGIYKRKSIDVEMLKKISEALNYDFFQFYVKPRIPLLEEEKGEYNLLEFRKLKEDFDSILKEHMELKEKYDLLKKVNELLEKNNQLLIQKTNTK